MKEAVQGSERAAKLPRLLTINNAAAELNLSVWTLRRAVWERELAHIRIGRSILLDENDVKAWLASQKVRRTEPQ